MKFSRDSPALLWDNVYGTHRCAGPPQRPPCFDDWHFFGWYPERRAILMPHVALAHGVQWRIGEERLACSAQPICQLVHRREVCACGNMPWLVPVWISTAGLTMDLSAFWDAVVALQRAPQEGNDDEST